MKKEQFAFTNIEIEQNLEEISDWYEKIKDRPPEEMAGFFTARLDGYEKKMKECFDEYSLLPALFPNDTETLLDLGCGTGLELDEIFKIFPDIKATAIDLTKPMLDELAAKHGDKNITAVCADYFEYDFGVSKYDAAVSVQSLHHFEHGKKKLIYDKIFRALKKGGVYIESDYTASSEEHEQLCLGCYYKQRKRFDVPDSQFVHIDIPMTIENRMELISAAGFSSVNPVNRAQNTVTLTAKKK